MQARSQTFALAIILIPLSATMAIAATLQQNLQKKNLQQQQSIQAQIQQVPAYCRAQYAKRAAGAARDQAIQMCMQQRLQSLSEVLKSVKQMMDQMNKRQQEIMRGRQ